MKPGGDPPCESSGGSSHHNHAPTVQRARQSCAPVPGSTDQESLTFPLWLVGGQLLLVCCLLL